MGDFHPWRARADRHRRGRVRQGGCRTGGWRDPAHIHGPGRHPREGFDLTLTRAIADAVSVPVIASGGVGTLDHLVEGVTQGHASAVLAASIFHFGDYSIARPRSTWLEAGCAGETRLLS